MNNDLKSDDGRTARGAQTKNKILQAALDLIGEHGPENFSAGVLAKKVGTAKSIIFHHFSSVDEIPLKALEMLLTEITRSLGGKNHASAEEYLLGLGESLLKLVDRNPRLMKSMFFFYQRALHDPKYQSALTGIINGFLEEASSRLKELSEHKITAQQLRSISLLLAMTLDGMGYYRLILGDRESFRQSWKLLVQLILGYVKQ